MNLFTINCWKDKNKEKEAENGPFFKKIKRLKSDWIVFTIVTNPGAAKGTCSAVKCTLNYFKLRIKVGSSYFSQNVHLTAIKRPWSHGWPFGTSPQTRCMLLLLWMKMKICVTVFFKTGRLLSMLKKRGLFRPFQHVLNLLYPVWTCCILF